MTPAPESKEVPKDWQNWTTFSKGSQMLMTFTHKITTKEN